MARWVNVGCAAGRILHRRRDVQPLVGGQGCRNRGRERDSRCATKDMTCRWIIQGRSSLWCSDYQAGLRARTGRTRPSPPRSASCPASSPRSRSRWGRGSPGCWPARSSKYLPCGGRPPSALRGRAEQGEGRCGGGGGRCVLVVAGAAGGAPAPVTNTQYSASRISSASCFADSSTGVAPLFEFRRERRIVLSRTQSSLAALRRVCALRGGGRGRRRAPCAALQTYMYKTSICKFGQSSQA